MKKLRKYSRELKEEAVKMVIEQGLKQPEVSRRLSIPQGTIGNWIAKAKADPEITNREGRSNIELADENKQLRKELAKAKMERDILKKATAYFAKESVTGTRL
jgi:transposase